MNDKNLVTIIVPVYNAEKTLKRCIDSILRQSYSNIEIIAINDGSTDNSLSVLKSYGKTINIINIENNGVSNARNLGVDNANGKFILFIDSDDYISDIYVESLINAYEPNTLVICNYYPFKNDENILMPDYNNIFDYYSKPYSLQ